MAPFVTLQLASNGVVGIRVDYARLLETIAEYRPRDYFGNFYGHAHMPYAGGGFVLTVFKPGTVDECRRILAERAPRLRIEKRSSGRYGGPYLQCRWAPIIIEAVRHLDDLWQGLVAEGLSHAELRQAVLNDPIYRALARTE